MEPDDGNKFDKQSAYGESVYPVTRHPKKAKKYIGFGFLAILLLAAAAYGGIKLFGSKKPAGTTSTVQKQQSEPGPAESKKDVPDPNKTSDYENGFLGITLIYPSTWTATESDSKDSVRLESPNFTYKTIAKGDTTGNFRMYIRKGARDIDGKYIGRGYALQPSEKLVYARPAPGQRTETSLTLFGQDSPDNFALFLIAGNYNLKKGDTLGPNYGKEPDTYIVAGGFSAKELKDDLATNPVAPELLVSSNAYKQAVEILKSLQLR